MKYLLLMEDAIPDERMARLRVVRPPQQGSGTVLIDGPFAETKESGSGELDRPRGRNGTPPVS